MEGKKEKAFQLKKKKKRNYADFPHMCPCPGNRLQVKIYKNNERKDRKHCICCHLEFFYMVIKYIRKTANDR